MKKNQYTAANNKYWGTEGSKIKMVCVHIQ